MTLLFCWGTSGVRFWSDRRKIGNGRRRFWGCRKASPVRWTASFSVGTASRNDVKSAIRQAGDGFLRTEQPPQVAFVLLRSECHESYEKILADIEKQMLFRKWIDVQVEEPFHLSSSSNAYRALSLTHPFTILSLPPHAFCVSSSSNLLPSS